MVWQLQTAKQRFSEVVDRALGDGPQVVTRHGREVVVVVAMSEWRRLSPVGGSFKDCLRTGPSLDGLDLERSSDGGRDIDL